MRSCLVSDLRQGAVDMASVKLVVSADVDNRALEGFICPPHSSPLHAYVTGKDYEIRIYWRRHKLGKLEVQV